MYEISVVIPLYNVEEYVKECLDSLVNQTIFEKLKVIVIDDGSTDSSAIIVDEFTNKYDNMEIHRFSNGGVSKARNRGIDLVETKYIAFVDPDDYLHPLMYEDLLANAKQDGVDICACATRRFNSESSRVPILHRNSIKDEYHSVKYYEVPKIAYDMSTCNKLFKTSLFIDNDIRYPVGRLYEDIDVSIKTFEKSHSVSIINKAYYNWRMREGSTTASRKEIKNFIDRVHIIEDSLRYVNKHNMDEDFINDFIEKSFRYDFIYYIDEFNLFDIEYQSIIMNELDNLIKDNLDKIYKLVPAKDKIKYYYIINNKAEKLANYINMFEENKIEKFTIDSMDIPAFGRKQSEFLKYEVMPSYIYAIDDEVDDINILLENTDQPFNPFVSSVKIDTEDNSINIYGGLIFYNIDNFSDNAILRVNILNIDNDNTTYVDNTKLNYYQEDYYITFDCHLELNWLNLNDRYKILVEIIINNETQNIYLVSPLNNNARPFYKIINGKIASVYYNFKNEIVIEVKELRRAIKLINLNKEEVDYEVLNSLNNEFLFLENQEDFSKIKLDDNKVPINSLIIDKRYKFIGQNSNGVGYDYTNVATKASFIDQSDYIVYASRGRKGQSYLTKIQKNILIKDINIKNDNIQINLVENEVINKKLFVVLNGEKDTIKLKKVNNEKYKIDVNKLKMRDDKFYKISAYILDSNNKPIYLSLNADENYHIDSRLKYKSKIQFIKNPLSKTFINRIKNRIGRLKV